MKTPLLWMPLFRWSQGAANDAWTLLEAEKFRLTCGDRAHVVFDRAGLAPALASVATTAPQPGLRGWASFESYATFSGAFDLEATVPERASQWTTLAQLTVSSPLDRIMLQRRPSQSLNALGHALTLVPNHGPQAQVFIDGLTWGFDAAYWVLSLHPNWHLYGSLELTFALELAESLGRPLSIVDCSSAKARPVRQPDQFGLPRGDPSPSTSAPATWL